MELNIFVSKQDLINGMRTTALNMEYMLPKFHGHIQVVDLPKISTLPLHGLHPIINAPSVAYGSNEYICLYFLFNWIIKKFFYYAHFIFV